MGTIKITQFVTTPRQHSLRLTTFCRLLILLIQGYRYFISPLLCSHCRFTPVCSLYATNALSLHGFWYGSYLVLRRLLCCHPWHHGGFDPVPHSRVKKI